MKNIYRLVIDLKLNKKIVKYKEKNQGRVKVYYYNRCRPWWNRSWAINLEKRKKITLAAKELKNTRKKNFKVFLTRKMIVLYL